MIFWQYIKGLNKGTEDGDSDKFSFLKWPDGKGNTIQYKEKYLPTFYFSNNQKFTTTGENPATWYGEIQTSKDYLKIEKEGNSSKWLLSNGFENDNSFRISLSDGTTKGLSYFCIDCATNSNSATKIRMKLPVEITDLLTVDKSFQIDASDSNNAIYSSNYSLSDGTSYPSNGFKIFAKSGIFRTAGSFFTAQNIYSVGLIKSNEYITAPYFNATSDKRAKTAITSIPWGSALQYICNNINIYNFKYKETDKPSIGVLAQELKDNPIGDFNFVDNIEASGENGDYMTVKESKLIYLALQAIKELKQENCELKERIERLESPFSTLKF